MRHLRWILGVALVAGTATAADWTQFRGPGGDGVSPEKDLPTRWSKTEGLRYKIALPGRGLSNPVIADGRVFLTACSGYRERKLHVLCLDEPTGKKLWERTFTASGNTACHPDTNMAAPTPATDGKTVYALFATADLCALDRDGNLLWYRSLVGDYPDITNQVGMASSPVLAGGVLCVPMESAGASFFAGLDPTTGKNVWKVKRERGINWATPLPFEFGGKAAVLYQSGGRATAYDAKSGEQLWEHKGAGSPIPSPAKGGGLIFVAGGEVHAIKAGPTEKEPQVEWKGRLLAGDYASPIYHDGKLYGVTAASLTCLDAAKGEQAWRVRVDGPFDGSPVIAGGHLYAVNRKGRTFVVRLGDKPEVVSRNDIEDKIQATPAVANGCIYLRSDKFLYCVGPAKK